MRGPSATRHNDGLTTLRGLARFRSMSLLCAMQMVFLPVFSVRLQAQTANVITPDGRTGTSLQTSGSVTNVTTSTISGNNAFNSFSQFSVGQGNTVNLQLPTGTQNLVNIVRDAPVYVNGTLNSYMNGAIGGNVYFADPKGFVVRPQRHGECRQPQRLDADARVHRQPDWRGRGDQPVGGRQPDGRVVSGLARRQHPYLWPHQRDRRRAPDRAERLCRRRHPARHRQSRPRREVRSLRQLQGPAQRQRDYREQRLDPYRRRQQCQGQRASHRAKQERDAEQHHGSGRQQHRCRQEGQSQHRKRKRQCRRDPPEGGAEPDRRGRRQVRCQREDGQCRSRRLQRERDHRHWERHQGRPQCGQRQGRHAADRPDRRGRG
ncbi:filamentous hemagglutinin family protein [Bradyrhizobium sp. i1.7.7]